MASAARIVIIGAGIVGTNLADELLTLGWTDVTGGGLSVRSVLLATAGAVLVLLVARLVLSRIRRGGPQAYRQRIGTSGTAKAGLALRGLADVGLSRARPRAAPRDGLWTRPRA